MSKTLSDVTYRLQVLTDASDKACITKLLNRMSKSPNLARVFIRIVIGNDYTHDVDHDTFQRFIKNTKNMINHKEDINKNIDNMGRLERIGQMSKTEFIM